MKYKKIIVIVMAVCVVAVGVFVVYKNHQEKIELEKEANFHIAAIEKFWDNEELFEQVKEHFLALPDDMIGSTALGVTLYFDRKTGHIVFPDKDRYVPPQDITISKDFGLSVQNLSFNLEPMSIHIQYTSHRMLDAKRVEDKTIKFEFKDRPGYKGIMYVMGTVEEEIKDRRGYQFLKENWYYYEQPAGV